MAMQIRAGRTPKYGQPLTERVNVLFTEEHLPQLAELAAQSGTGDVSTWLREIALGERQHPSSPHPSMIGTDSTRIKRLNKVPCGDWKEAVESADDYVLSPDVARTLEANQNDVMVPAEGDSMEGARIFDGDEVLMRPLPDGVRPRKREIALVQIIRSDGSCESTIKHWMGSDPVLLHDGEGVVFSLGEDVEKVMAVAVARGLIARPH